ncbi:MAG: ABC transporter substrate-binding protein [Oscillospiraceae bacterium]|jgi:iron complex transport system substrate-binding protein|nr:ABC transporter substrate-binding protein [Oscillospiraceae bacterium]
MSKLKRLPAIAVIAAMLVIMASCAPTPAPTAEPTQTQQTNEPAATNAPATAAPTAEPTAEPTPESTEVRLIDFTGREIVLPKPADRISGIHPTATLDIWRLAGDKLVSIDWVFEMININNENVAFFTPEEKERLRQLPVTGTFFRNMNFEQMLTIAPEVVVTLNSDPNIELEEEQIGVPVVAINKDGIDTLPQSFRIVGALVGNPFGDEIADFWDANLKLVTDESDKVPKSDRKNVLFVGKSGNINITPSEGTIFSSAINAAGVNNLGDLLDVKNSEEVEINVEQILAWNPDLIVVPTQVGYDAIMSTDAWQTIPAVQRGDLYVMRQYAGMDGTGSLMGSTWLHNLVYHPDDDAYEEKFDKLIYDFTELMYGVQLTDEQIHQPGIS